MNYKSYQHIEKLGTIETEGILNGEVHLSYKIDGSNGCVYLKDNGELGFGSRKRDLSITEDNMGFMTNYVCNKELYSNFLKILKSNPNYIIYGEWLVPVTIKSTIKTHGESSMYLTFIIRKMVHMYHMMYIKRY